MVTIQNLADFPAALRGGVLCVGNFDGVHGGHALMLRTGRQEATRRGVPFVIMTFDPHPSVLLNPGNPRLPLTTREQRLELLSAFSPDAILVIPTTREFLAITGEEFLGKMVQGTLGACHIVEGANFTYGRGAKGTVETLQQQAATYGFEVTIVPTETRVMSDLTVAPVSSTLVRWLLQKGRVADAGICLDRPWTLRSKVVEGQKRGRTIGFPTANLQTPQLLPAPGVYAGTALVERRQYRAAISIGNNPTFENQPLSVEAHLLDFSGDLYGLTMDLSFLRWLRDMEKYSGTEPLIRQLQRDVAATRQLIPLPDLSLQKAS